MTVKSLSQVTLATNSNYNNDSMESSNQHPDQLIKERSPTTRPSGRAKKKK